MKQATTLTLFIVAVVVAILLLAAAAIALTCSRPPRMPQFTPRVWYTPDNDPEIRHSCNSLRRPISFASSISARRDTFVALYIPSESFKDDIICVSPSKPIMIGNDESPKGVLVKLMVTPPTPSKAKLGNGSLDEFSCDSDIEEEEDGSFSSSSCDTFGKKVQEKQL
ncbi:hypothetical protein P691DRAFT_756553 [Macrolepiota fuliginosa MF-IS2]|uniref:Uncharacterized protein n=1 Tax=Macrolepiota fuliginosa MF-IS2 TaxID=1400762 RepID=A0A9P5XJV8_9AGAR|nr:hypothetical protein P691DRAFT_756553 [Macrolepiota fuliginosa MF-IS2]